MKRVLERIAAKYYVVHCCYEGPEPVEADLAHEAPDMARRPRARRCLAGAQHHRHRSAGGRVVDMDRQEAALSIVTVPERQLLVTVPHPSQVSSMSSVTCSSGVV